ncbi:esterase E4-like isoform X1 [Tachypleus tridentatus]|uniref:esterase E4-like isoform X1 n=1 Tax=Tachypleus tridentatus TaxID=6853 RepID=UPI003FCEEB50
MQSMFLLTHFGFIGVFFLSWTSCQRFDSSELMLPQGHIRGRLLQTKSNRRIHGFLGIPYATAPIGPFRFKASVRHPGWSDTLDATEYRSSCPQVDPRGMQTGGEDCLFLNVFTPRLPNDNYRGSSTNYPVMVFIHGGYFDSGSSSQYGPEKLVDKGVVLVTFNYRLGILGFLSTGDEASSGNWGLLDQRLALQWVQENIGNFGGDATSVTLFGQGAGAASVIYHIISPVSQRLFHRAIAESGSALCPWALEREPLQYAREVALLLKCPTESSFQLVECISRKSTGDILRAQTEGKSLGNFPIRAVPVIDRQGTANPVIPDDPLSLLQRGNFVRVPLVIGINREEGAFFYPLLRKGYMENSLRNSGYLRDILIPSFLQSTSDLAINSAVVEAIMFAYFIGVDTANLTQVLKPFINMTTDAMYVACNDLTSKTYSQLNIPTYMYVFEHRGVNSMTDLRLNQQMSKIDAGVSHGDELFYLFDLQVDGIQPLSQLDNLISNRMVTLWTDFAKFGVAPHFVNYEYPAKWPRLQPNNLSYYRIEGHLRIARDYRQRESDLWLHHLPSLAEIHTLPPTTSPLVEEKVEPVYRTLAWAMVAVAIALFILVIVLLGFLYNQRKSQSFKASPELGHSRMSGSMSGSTLY